MLLLRLSHDIVSIKEKITTPETANAINLFSKQAYYYNSKQDVFCAIVIIHDQV